MRGGASLGRHPYPIDLDQVHAMRANGATIAQCAALFKLDERSFMRTMRKRLGMGLGAWEKAQKAKELVTEAPTCAGRLNEDDKKKLSQIAGLAQSWNPRAKIATCMAMTDAELDTFVINKTGLAPDVWFKQQAALGEAMIRQSQLKAARDGNVGMLTHLGKIQLGQVDATEEAKWASLPTRMEIQVVKKDQIEKIQQLEQEVERLARELAKCKATK